MKAHLLFMMVVLSLLGAVAGAIAQEPQDKPFLAKPFMKLARGTVNVITAPLELPNQVYILSDYASENSSYGIETAAGAIEGLFTGIGFALWRLGAGAYDVVTFPAPRYESCLISPPYLTSSYEAYYARPEENPPAEEEPPPPSGSGAETGAEAGGAESGDESGAETGSE